MTSPLALFLTNFAAPPPAALEMIDLMDAPLPLGAMDAPPSFDSQAAVAEAVDAAMTEAHEQHAMELAALRESHEGELASALAAARDEWAASTSAVFATNLDSAIQALRASLSDGLAAVLRPLVAEHVRERVARELVGALDRLLADSAQPVLRVKGPEDLCGALHAARPAVEIDWVIDESPDVEMIAGSTHIETKLASALADIAATEH